MIKTTFILFCVLLASCSKPGPEDTLRLFIEATSKADWQLAQALSEDRAYEELVLGCFYAGCKPYDLIIYQIECHIINESATCDCVEGIAIEGTLPMQWTQKYHLVQRNGAWKVNDFNN